jgi:hypothetical protein
VRSAPAPGLTGGVCVSTVSIARSHNERPLHGRRSRRIVMDAADGACHGVTHSDDPAAGSAFTTKGDIDTQGGPPEGTSARDADGRSGPVMGLKGTRRKLAAISSLIADARII